MRYNLLYDRKRGWFLNQYVVIDTNNFIAIVLSDETVEVQVLNWNFEFKYDKSSIDLI